MKFQYCYINIEIICCVPIALDRNRDRIMLKRIKNSLSKIFRYNIYFYHSKLLSNGLNLELGI